MCKGIVARSWYGTHLTTGLSFVHDRLIDVSLNRADMMIRPVSTRGSTASRCFVTLEGDGAIPLRSVEGPENSTGCPPSFGLAERADTESAKAGWAICSKPALT